MCEDCVKLINGLKPEMLETIHKLTPKVQEIISEMTGTLSNVNPDAEETLEMYPEEMVKEYKEKETEHLKVLEAVFYMNVIAWSIHHNFICDQNLGATIDTANAVGWALGGMKESITLN